MDCTFCRIVKKEINVETIHEDELVIAFLDKNPVSKGHTLIIPKQHVENVFDISEDVLRRITEVAKLLAERSRKELGATGVNLLHASGKDAQQSLFHFHFHLVPRYPNDSLDLWIHSRDQK